MVALRRLSSVVLGIAVLTATIVAMPSPAAASPNGLFRVRAAGTAPSLCLSVHPPTFTAVVAPCSSSATQKWQFVSVAGSGLPQHFRQVKNLSDGRCLDVGDRGGRLTGRIATMPCNNSSNQAWHFPDPGTTSHACNFKASLCDWRPEFTDAQLSDGYVIAFSPPYLTVRWITWQLEAVSA